MRLFLPFTSFRMSLNAVMLSGAKHLCRVFLWQDRKKILHFVQDDKGLRMTRGEERSGEGLLGDEAVDDLTGLVGRSVWGGVEAGETGGADCETAEAVVC